MKNKITLAIALAVFLCVLTSYTGAKDNADPNIDSSSTKTVAIGDVDAGYDTHGRRPSDVKETIQILMKKRLEKLGKGSIQANIVSPAVEAEGSETEAEGPEMPMLPTDRAPTQKEMAKYMASIQKWQNKMTGKVKTFKPVSERNYVEFSVSGGKSGLDTGGLSSTVSQFGGSIPADIADVGTRSAKVDLVCTMRDPKTGAIQDRYVAKASSVKVKNLAGYTSYDYGSDSRDIERLFNSAVDKCAKWVAENIR